MEGPKKKVNKNKALVVKSDTNPAKVWGKGPVKIFDIELDCYILEDGVAILNQSKMMKAIGRPWKGTSRTDRPSFIGAINLQQFITPELEEKLKVIELKDGAKTVYGYNADVLPLVCNVYLEARQAGVLSASQLPIAQTCEILIRSFARVGIVAIIYEQLGFERYKHPEALKLLIESYLSEEIRKWSKEFPDELFRQMDRIYGNNPTTSRNRPQYYAKFIRKYIYDPIEKGLVLKELDSLNPITEKGTRKVRHHQGLSDKVGLPALRAQIWQVVALLSTSSGKPQYERAFNRLLGQAYQPSFFEEN